MSATAANLRTVATDRVLVRAWVAAAAGVDLLAEGGETAPCAKASDVGATATVRPPVTITAIGVISRRRA